MLQLAKVAKSLRTNLLSIWKDFKIVIKNLKEVPVSEINHYQVLVLKNLVTDKYAAEKTQLETQMEADLLKFSELNKQV